MPSDVAFMHKYLCKPNSDPRRGTTRGEIIFSYEYKWPGLPLFLPRGEQVCPSSRLLARISGVANAFSPSGRPGCFL